MSGRTLPLISDQLDLWEDEVARLPWRGMSPRGLTLTKSPDVLFLKRERQKDERFFVDPEQHVFSFLVDKAPWKYQGAPLLKGGL